MPNPNSTPKNLNPNHYSTNKTTIAIIGGGPAAMMLAAKLDPKLYQVSIYEKNKTLGRKFLVAGKGGFNLTHSEEMTTFSKRYQPTSLLHDSLELFSNADLREWLDTIGIATYVGSSRRVFPIKDIKPITVLNKILEFLKNRGVQIHTSKNWIGWDKDLNLLFQDALTVNADIEVFALGGGSWKVTGSDGHWCKAFEKRGVRVEPLRAANCGFKALWPHDFIKKHSGQPLKNISISHNNKTVKGEALITDFGLEGNAIYALSADIMQTLDETRELSINQHVDQPLKTSKVATIYIDLKPTVSIESLKEKYDKALLSNKKNNTTTILKETLKLNKTHLALLKSTLTKDTFLNPTALLQSIKALPIALHAAAPIDEAISTLGGIALTELDADFKLKTFSKQTYYIGEMVDWYAPTGGYLLQGCFSMGAWVAHVLNSTS